MPWVRRSTAVWGQWGPSDAPTQKYCIIWIEAGQKTGLSFKFQFWEVLLYVLQ